MQRQRRKMAPFAARLILLWGFVCFLSLPLFSQGEKTIEYTWQNFEQDTIRFAFKINKNELTKAIREFGVPVNKIHFYAELPPKTIVLRWSNEEEKRKALQEFKADSLKRIRTLDSLKENWRQSILQKGFVEKGGDLEPDFVFLYRRNFERMNPVFKVFDTFSHSQGYHVEEEIKLILSFVQHIPYRVLPRLRAGTKILTAGLLTPLEVLANKYGDCDSKSLLFATLVGHMPGKKVILVEFKDHVITGYSGKAKRGQKFLRLGGRKYILCETSSPSWPPGELDKKLVRKINTKDFEVILLN